MMYVGALEGRTVVDPFYGYDETGVRIARISLEVRADTIWVDLPCGWIPSHGPFLCRERTIHGIVLVRRV